ncbi:MAG: thioesterase [Gammaproteobacteria bacterium]|nr:thioesterase [Gammaproteobacteria bacterium]
MYPYIKLATTLLKARKRPRLNVEDTSVLQFRPGINDIDIFGELNNARYFNYMELGRWDYSYRIGFVDVIRQKKWGLVVGGASIRYRRRIPFRKKFTLTTKVICHDNRWFYFLQEMHIGEQICSSALVKAGASSKHGLVPATEIAIALGKEGWGEEMPDWVQAWVEAEGRRPWPS